MNTNQYSQAISAYQSQPSQWTRVDMLLALYAKTIESLQAVANAVAKKETAFEHKTRTVFLLEQIVEGIDSEKCDYADRLLALCEYALHGVQTDDVTAIESAAKSLGEVRSAFEEVRDDAIALEMSGVIPPIDSAIELER